MESVSLMFVGDLQKSLILNKEELKTVVSFLPHKLFTSKILFVATENQFKSATFHKLCDKHKNTLTIIKSDSGKVFGGFTPLAWQSDSNYVNDEAKESFLFSVTNKTKHPLFQNIIYAIYNNPSYGPTFGGGHDIYISTDCNMNSNSYSNFGYCYKAIDTTQYGTQSAQSYLAGAYNFKVVEYEVYEITPILRED